MQNAAQSYFQTQINTTNQGEIIVMLYDGAMRFLQQAIEKINEKDVASKGIYISKAIDIINELDSCLNMEKGGDLAKNLHNLYFLCSTRLVQGNIKQDISILEGVIGTLAGLREAFAQIMNDPAAQAMATKMAAQQNPNATAFTSRVMTQAPSPNVGKSTANSAYAQVARQAGIDATLKTSEVSTSSLSLAALKGQYQAASQEEVAKQEEIAASEAFRLSNISA